METDASLSDSYRPDGCSFPVYKYTFAWLMERQTADAFAKTNYLYALNNYYNDQMVLTKKDLSDNNNFFSRKLKKFIGNEKNTQS